MEIQRVAKICKRCKIIKLTYLTQVQYRKSKEFQSTCQHRRVRPKKDYLKPKIHKYLLKEGKLIFALEIQEDLALIIIIQLKALGKQRRVHQFNLRKKQFQALELELMISNSLINSR